MNKLSGTNDRQVATKKARRDRQRTTRRTQSLMDRGITSDNDQEDHMDIEDLWRN